MTSSTDDVLDAIEHLTISQSTIIASIENVDKTLYNLQEEVSSHSLDDSYVEEHRALTEKYDEMSESLADMRDDISRIEQNIDKIALALGVYTVSR